MRKIDLGTKLSTADLAHLRIILKKAGTRQLEIKTEVNWKELETALINIKNKELTVWLESEVKYESETGDHIKRLATLCKQVIVKTLRLSEGRCWRVGISTNKISLYDVYLQSGEDVTRLQHLVSQYQKWEVEDYLYLTELGSDDWALLAQLFSPLTSHLTWVKRVEIRSDSTSHPAQETLRRLWDKTVGWGWWMVNQEKYGKSDDKNFDKMFNKHFK